MFGLKLLTPIAPKEKPFSRPSWADPQFTLRANDLEEQVITTPAGTGPYIFPNDPKRWAIGFSKPVTTPTACVVSPFPDVQRFNVPVTEQWTGCWFTLFNYGPMVPNEWYIFSSVAIDVKVTYIRIT